MSSPELTPETSPVVFTSWKEIAAYLGRGIRTVQRWEAQLGLPVKRPHCKSKGIVRASKEELDLWISKYWPVAAAGRTHPKTGEFYKNIEMAIQLSQEHRRLLTELRQSLREISNSCKKWQGFLHENPLKPNYVVARNAVDRLASDRNRPATPLCGAQSPSQTLPPERPPG